MEPEHIAFGGGATETILHPLVAVWMLIAVALILTLPRRKAIVPFLLVFFNTPIGQVVVVGGVHFNVYRIVILSALVRMATYRGASSEEKFAGGWSALDRVVTLWTISALVIVSLRWMETQALIKNLGEFLDALGGYCVIRFMVPDREALRRMVKALALVCLIQGACMVSEQFTYQNVFGFLGAHSPEMREGHIRSQAVMGSLYGGVFAGALIPVFLWLWGEGKSRMAACAGLVGASAMALAAHSSTSWMAYGGSLLALCFWPLRRQMRFIRWSIVAMLVGLHLVMNGPVWSLIEHIDLSGGSSSYHRYMLVDNCIRHFSDWWLLGFSHPGLWGFDMWDLCNQFVNVSVTGGLVTLVLYIMIYSRSFGAVGKARRLVSGDRAQEWLLWCLGSSLFANVVASFGINYLAQLQLYFSTLLVSVSVATYEARQAAMQTAEPRVKARFAPGASTAAGYLRPGEAR